MRALFWSPGPKYSRKKALFLIASSMMLVSGSISCSYFAYTYLQRVHAGEVIKGIIQIRSSEKEVANSFFAELLNLSEDQPIFFQEFDEELAIQKLSATHLFNSVSVKKIKPHFVFIEYELCTSLAYLGNCAHTAVNEKGVFIPSVAFLSPCNQPKIFIDKVVGNPWGQLLSSDHREIIGHLYAGLDRSSIKTIDLSKIEAQSAGLREIVVQLKNGNILRLSQKNLETQLSYYKVLQSQQLLQNCIIDLRLSQMAYIANL